MRTEVIGQPGSSQFDGGIIPKGAKGYTACLTCPQSPAFHFGHLPPLHFFCTLGLARCLQYSSSTCLPSFDKQYTLRCFWPLPQETEHCKYKVTTDQLSHSYRGHGYPEHFLSAGPKSTSPGPWQAIQNLRWVQTLNIALYSWSKPQKCQYQNRENSWHSAGKTGWIPGIAVVVSKEQSHLTGIKAGALSIYLEELERKHFHLPWYEGMSNIGK